MARKKVSRTLFALPRRSVLGNGHKSDRLLEILRRVAITNQKHRSQAFYSMREVAKQFGLPISSVSRVYRRLEKEGVLNRVRGSKTILQGHHFDRRLSVRAFVGLPASLSKFVTLQNYRAFFIHTRRELRLRGFATAMVFFDEHEPIGATFADRLRTYEMDTVIWFMPPRESKRAAVRLTEMGVRMLAISEEIFPAIPCRYRIQRMAAIQQLLSAWNASGTTPITVVRGRLKESLHEEERFERMLQELDAEYETVSFVGNNAETFLRKLNKPKTGGLAFASGSLASLLCFRAPEAVTRLLQSRRVALVDGPMNMPFAPVPDARVDLVTPNWQLVAETIVNDLVTQDAFDASQQIIFEADLHLRVPLNQFAQRI